jgi:ketol-acid reductoisomerase
MSVNVDPANQLRLLEGGYIASLETYHHLHCIVSCLVTRGIFLMVANLSYP